MYTFMAVGRGEEIMIPEKDVKFLMTSILVCGIIIGLVTIGFATVLKLIF